MTQIFIGILLFSLVARSQSVEPGYWQEDASIEINGIPLPPSQDKECVSLSDAKEIKKTIVKELDKKGCSPTKWTMKGQNIEVSLKCTKSGLEATGSLKGTVKDKSYDISGDAEGTYQGIPAQASLSLKGKWLKSCKQ